MRLKRAVATALMLVPLASVAQEIGVKSIPVATGSQFLLYPSEYVALGGIRIAQNDALADPFDNPAKGTNVHGGQLTTTPHLYSIGETSLDGHTTRTIPVAALFRKGRFFGSGALAWQEMVRRDWGLDGVFFADLNSSRSSEIIFEESSTTRNNLYLTAAGGMELREGLSLGVSLLYANLKGIEGVQLLYSAGDDVDQDGRMATYKVGLYQRWPSGRTAEVLLQHHRYKMSHSMVSAFWNFDDLNWTIEERLEEDETNGVALRLGYTAPWVDGWTFGARVVGDWKTHPKIPNYDLMQIPRDPGNTGAYNVGVGLSRKISKTTYAFDVIYEPIWSHTWANAEEDIVVEDVRHVKAGEMTVENYFRFNNSLFRMGVRQAGQRLAFGLAFEMRLIRYTLDQEDFVQRSSRVLKEAWGEWTLRTGLGYDFTGFRLQYLSILTWGTGQPFVTDSFFAQEDLASQMGFVVAPAGALDLIDARVWTHRLSIHIPLSE